MKRSGIILTIVGILMLLGSLIGGGILAVQGSLKMMDEVGSGIQLSGPSEITVSEGETLHLYRKVGTADPTCQINGPGQVRRGSLPTALPHPFGEENYDAFEAVTFPAAGDYVIECSADTIIAPPMQASTMGTVAGGLGLGIGGGILGLTALIAGIVLWVVGAKRQRTVGPGSHPSPSGHPPRA